MHAGRKPKVLVVDDEQVIADTLAKILDLNGYDASAVYSGTAAVESARALQPDLVISDVIMQDMNGIEAARRIRDRAANSKIVFISLEISDELAEAAVAVGAQAYIAKREIRAKLLPTIDSLFGK